MGCRVNGPGETDDADLGLWCGPNYVNLKRGSEALGQFPYDAILPRLKTGTGCVNRKWQVARILTNALMKLPNAENAIIEEVKLVEYLLNLNHRRGASKAKLLASIGYVATGWQRLADDLRQQHVAAELVEQRETVWGKRYDIVAPLTGPTGDTLMFHSVWQIDIGSDQPRLITMYPE